MSTTAVEKGLQFEKAVVDMLNKCGFKAWRTNQSNEADPERYKAGFDGGVDIIATFDVIKPICRNVCFYIQCNHQAYLALDCLCFFLKKLQACNAR